MVRLVLTPKNLFSFWRETASAARTHLFSECAKEVLEAVIFNEGQK